MMILGNNYRTKVLLLMIISTFVRGFLATSLELGNDEVYYRLYALYPDWSHFDHPLMVGLVMQIFSLNMWLQTEFFLRLGSIVFGAVNIWLIFCIGVMIKNERTGFFAALLYTASIYATVITGIFILPDTPQSILWLISIYLMLKTLPGGPNAKNAFTNMLLIGLSLGLGLLSKYTTAFLWLGLGMYVTLFRREWLKNASIYAGLLVTFICALPILIWNFQNNFISFAFHTERVEVVGYSLNLNTFFTEILGEFFYNNPVNFILILISLVYVVNEKLKIRKSFQAILVLSSLPLIISFGIFSLFRETLPHWSAPAYTVLIILAAAWLDQLKSKMLAKGLVISAVTITGIVLMLGYFQINHGIIDLSGNEDPNRLGKNDFSLDMFGYQQTGNGFAKIVERDIKSGQMPEKSVLFGDNWFPLANYDFYAAYPLGMEVYGISDLHHLHKYAWVNEIQGGFKEGMTGYYITDSKYFRPPNKLIRNSFETAEATDTIPIYRNGKLVKNAYVFRLKNMIKVPEDPFKESP